MLSYYIYPTGAPGHNSVLEARLEGVSSYPYLPAGLTIIWRQDGTPIKSGDTYDSGASDPYHNQRINTGDATDLNFDATDSGSTIDFVINGTTYSNSVYLSNNTPTLQDATVVKDAYGFSAKRPSFQWTFVDQDGDPQYMYRVKIGSVVGASDLHDSGQVLSSSGSYVVPSTATAMVAGSTFYWAIEVSDGEKTTATDPDSTIDRVIVTSSGSGVVNTNPVVSNVLINGYSGSPEVATFTPTISWTYSDIDGQPQQSYHVIVSTVPALVDIMWEAEVSSNQTSIAYNNDLTGSTLNPHFTYYVGVSAFDTYEESSVATEDFQVAHRPVITAILVNGEINPTNLKSQQPTFTWSVHDEDDDPITGYEIRVGDVSEDLGTDSFVGNIWSPGFKVTRESFETQMTLDAGAFPGCVFPKEIVPGTTYYFQVMVRNGITQPADSIWFTGYFRLNNVPTATDLAIIPSSPYNSDDLEATWQFVDDPGDVESDKSEIKWYKDNAEQKEIGNKKAISSGWTKPFEEWYFTVRPHDGLEYGSVYTSSSVTIVNRPPEVIGLAINPSSPRTNDELEAVFSVSDPDGDEATITINWYKNGAEQHKLRNRRKVPPFLTSVDDEWYVTITPTDGYTGGSPRTSSTVTILNSRPEVNAFLVNDEALPSQLDDPNPTMKWIYSDADNHPQEAYQIVIGTKPLRTMRELGATGVATPNMFFCVTRENGIVSVAENGDIVSGNDVFDSGVIQSNLNSYQYATDDYMPSLSLSAPDSTRLNGYRLDPGLATMRLSSDSASGNAIFDFVGQTGTYEVELSYLDEEEKPSKYELSVDGIIIDTFSSAGKDGSFKYSFRATSINSGSKISINGSAIKDGASAAFSSLSFAPIQEFDIDAEDFDVLSGYVSDDGGGIKLVGLAGSASTEFDYPSGTYNVEIVYVTESSGNPTLSLSVNNTTVDSFTYESGVRTRSRFVRNLSINSGDRIKVNGARGGGAASARVKKVVFKPTDTLRTGAKFKEGLSYYASIRVFDGREWSNWYTTRFTMSGWAWVSSVSNTTGWTIEARFSLLALVASTDTSGTTDDAPGTAEGFSGVTVASTTTTSTCASDAFQGLRFYDGTSFGWLRLQPDKVELLVSEPLEYELDGFVAHTYRITVTGQDIKLYVDEDLVIDGTGKFTQPTSEKMVEFGDIAGRQQTNGSEWEAFRYSINGAYAPNALVDYDLDEVQRFTDASVGRMKEYDTSLYVSVDPDDDERSSKVYRYDEGSTPESRSVLALTKTTTTAVLVDPNRTGNMFGSSGKFIGTQRGLQYVLGSKPFPFDYSTRMDSITTDNNWAVESTCSGACFLTSNGILNIDTTSETGSKFVKFTQRKATDPWVSTADNAKGWTIEARVKIANDGSGNGIDANTSFVLGSNDQCNPASGISVNELQTTKAPEDDGLNAPSIIINDGRFQEVVQFFSGGIRLKYASLFSEQDLTNQFYTIRIIGKGTSIAVYCKGDLDRFFRRMILAPNGLYVKTQSTGDQEAPHITVDEMGAMHVVYQDSQDGEWGIFYTKTIHEEVVSRGSGLYSASFEDFDRFVNARPGFGLPPDSLGPEDFDGQTLFSGGASFQSWGTRTGDLIIAFSKSNSALNPRKFKILSVPHETIIKVDTKEDLSDTFSGVDYVVMRGDETWLPPVKVSSETRDTNNPRILLSSSSESFVAYHGYEYGSTEVFVRRGIFDPFYATWKETARLTNSRFDSSNPDLVQRPNGNLIVVWQDSRNNKDRSQIYVSEIPIAEFGVGDSYPNILATPDSLHGTNPKVVALDEKVIIVYEDDLEEDGNFDIYAVELDDELTPGTPVKISNATGSTTKPCICSSKRDVFVAWQDDGLSTPEIHFVKGSEAISKTSSTSWGTPIRLTSSRGESLNPDIQVDSNGNVFVLFQDDRNKNTFYDLYVSRYDSANANWLSSNQQGSDTKIENYMTSSAKPVLALDSFGNLGVAWEAVKDGKSRIARTSFDSFITMDTTVVGHFPLDDNGSSTTVVNNARKIIGAITPPLEAIVLSNKSSSFSDGRLGDAKTVSSGIVSGLLETDSFNVIFFDSSISKFQSSFVLASSSNKTASDTFVAGISASGVADLNQSLTLSLAESFVTDESKNKIIILVDDGNPNSGEIDAQQIRSNFLVANEYGVKVFCFGLSGANQSLLSGLASDNEGQAIFQDDYDSLSEAFSAFYEVLDDNRKSGQKFDLSFESSKNGTSFHNTDSYHIDAPDAGVSLANPDDQGGFELVSTGTGRGFSIDSSLLNTTGAIDLWMKPHWPSNDTIERVIFGNAWRQDTTPNRITCGVRAAADGNDLYLRIVDENGVARETFVNNAGGQPREFDWDTNDLVHLRMVWDQNAVGTSSIRSVSFPTTSTGYACSEDGYIWKKTTDGGTTWTRQVTNVTYELYSIDFVDLTTGWACGEMGTVLKTTDGTNWSIIDTGNDEDLNGIFFRTSSIGYAVGAGGLVLRTVDGGTTWTQSTTSNTSTLNDVAVCNNGSSEVVLVIGSNNQVLRSTDDGVTFTTISSSTLPIEADWFSVSKTHQSGAFTSYVVGSSGGIISTSDLGASWSSSFFDWGIGYQPHLYGVSHGPNSNHAFVTGQNGALARTSDGSTFVRVTTGVEDGIIRAIEANFGGNGDNQTIVAAGVGGTVFTSTNSGDDQAYSMTQCGNLRIIMNGKELVQHKVNDGPFQWDPSSGPDLVFGDYEQSGSHSVNAVLDEIFVYSIPPPVAALNRRKDAWIHQSVASNLLIEQESEKRIEWGDVSPLVRTTSYWTKIEMFLCGAREPLHVFAWDSQIGLVDDVVRDIAADSSGLLWVATEHGISSLDINELNEDINRWMSGLPLRKGSNDRITNYTNIVDGLVADSVSSVVADPNNHIWAGTSRGLMRLVRTTGTKVSEVDVDPVDVAAQEGDEPVNAPATQFETFTTDDGLPSNNVLTLEMVGDNLFVGTDEGLAVINTESSQTSASASSTSTEDASSNVSSSLDISIFNESHGLPSNRIQSVAQENVSGHIWIGTDKGLARFSEEGSITFDMTTGMPNANIFSITIDSDDIKYIGTGFGVTKIDGTDVSYFQPSDGVGFGAVIDGDVDGHGVKWFSTSDGLLELNEDCSSNLIKYGIDDGLLGHPGITDYQYYYILGGQIPHGSCNKSLVNVAVNGSQLSGGFRIDDHVPWIVFDRPLTPSDKVEVCVDPGWRKVYDFDGNPSDLAGLATVETTLSKFYLYRKMFPSGIVRLGASFASGAENEATAMYTVFVVPADSSQSTPVSSVASPTGTVINQSAQKGVTSIYSGSTDVIQVLPSVLSREQNVAMPSADSGLIDEEYLEMTLSADAFVYVAYDSRSNSLPGWLRSFSPVRAVSRVTDMETFTDGTGKEKLFLSIEGTTGCVYDILKDPNICDISDQIAVDQTPPDGCATITRLNSLDEAILAITATDAVTGVSDMQVSAYENFTTDGTAAVGWVSFQSTYNLQLPEEIMDPVEELDETSPIEDDPQSPEQFPDIEYTIIHEHLEEVMIGTKTPGRVYQFNKSTQKISFLFDTDEDEVLSMVSFGNDLIVGTGTNGRAFRWDGTNLTMLLLPSGERITSLGAFDNRVFFGTSPNGRIYQMDQFGTIQLFMDTNETSVNGFAIFGGNLYWCTSNDQVNEADALTVTTRKGHRHSVTVQSGASRLFQVTGQTTLVNSHTHQVVSGVVQTSSDHDHALNGTRSGKVYKLDLATGLTSIVHSDTDSFVTAIVSTSIAVTDGLLFVGTYPNGKILRFIPDEAIFIKSFDTVGDRINKLRVIDNIVYSVSDDDIFYFDGSRWQFFGSVVDEILDFIGTGDDILVVRSTTLGRTSKASDEGGAKTPEKVCAYVRFRDVAGNVTLVRDDDGNLIECYSPCYTIDGGGDNGDGGDDGGDGSGGGGGGGGSGVNPMLQGSHRIVEVDDDAKVVFRLDGPDPFLSGNRVEEEVGVYYSEVLNGTTSLVQWTSLSWTGTTPTGASITIAVRSSNTSAEIADQVFGAEFTSSSDNDISNMTGQFLQFRATLKVTTAGTTSPELDKVDIQLKTSQAVHYYTTNFTLPDNLKRGILTYTGCLNPPVTDLVFGISGKDSTDFSDYFVVSPRKVFEVPTDHQTTDLRVGIKLISSPETVPVVDEFALLFSLANDAIIRLNLPGQPTETEEEEIPGLTTTVVTESTQGHSHQVTFDSDITDQSGINGQTSINGGHSHLVVNGVIQIAAGHTHEFEI